MRDLRSAAREELAGLEDGGVFDRAGHNMSGLASSAYRANQREIICLRAAGGENDLVRFGADQRGDLCSRLVDNRAGPAPFLVQARRITIGTAKKWPHRLQHS